jgi:hypothetical protein
VAPNGTILVRGHLETGFPRSLTVLKARLPLVCLYALTSSAQDAGQALPLAAMVATRYAHSYPDGRLCRQTTLWPLAGVPTCSALRCADGGVAGCAHACGYFVASPRPQRSAGRRGDQLEHRHMPARWTAKSYARARQTRLGRARRTARAIMNVCELPTVATHQPARPRSRTRASPTPVNDNHSIACPIDFSTGLPVG